MKRDDNKNGVSLFSQSEELIGQDPIEEIFALNLGDFIAENLISEELAKKIGSGIKNKRESLKNQLKELVSFYSLQNTLCVLSFDAYQEKAIFNSISESITKMLDAENCKIYLSYEFSKTNSHDDLIPAGTSDGNAVKSYKLDDDNITVKAFNTQDTIIENDFCAVPMLGSIYTTGVITVKNPDGKHLNRKYINLVESIASLLATSMVLQKEIDNANSLISNETSSTGDLQNSRAELTALIGDLCDYQQDFVENLAKAVDTKGHYTVAHSKNTAKLAKLICKELALNEKTTDLIYYAGLLQNIGKIALPEKIFSVAGKLSPEEIKQIQSESKSGVQLLMNINFLSEVVPYVMYKSERFDGSGRPEGLKGNSIPLGSRIIAAADAYCALTSDRPYRKAVAKDEALEIMKKEAGTKWDSVVINALAKVV